MPALSLPRSTIRRGNTLVEVAVASLLVGVVLVTAMKTVGAVIQTRRRHADLHQGPALARQLIAEVLQAAYADPETPGNPVGLDDAETAPPRADFDDVDDYHNWNAASAQYKDGTPIGGATGWQRQVSVMLVDPSDLSASPAVDLGTKLIMVQVTSPDGKVTQLAAIRSRDGALEQPPFADVTVVTHVDAELQLGSQPTAIVSGTNVVNHATD